MEVVSARRRLNPAHARIGQPHHLIDGAADVMMGRLVSSHMPCGQGINSFRCVVLLTSSAA